MRYIFLIILLIVPVISFAQIVPCSGVDCSACDIVSLGQNILKFFVRVSAAIAALMFAWAGIKMVTAGGDMGKIAEGRRIFTQVAIGFIIILAAWLIVDTIMKSVVKDDYFGPWNEIECAADTEQLTPPTTPSDDEPVIVVPTTGTLTHDAAIAQLGDDISVYSSGGCTNAAIATCTSLDGIQSTTLQPVVDLKSACPTCNVIVTGGTEVGHSNNGQFTHANGYKIDIDDTPSVQSYLESNLTRDGSVSGYPRYVDSSGNQWLDEGDHWDIQVTG